MAIFFIMIQKKSPDKSGLLVYYIYRLLQSPSIQCIEVIDVAVIKKIVVHFSIIGTNV
tara:strand:- start:847 stop:1020 length:174 start_codon:yes stop_codon:yes gene_type:complete